MSTQQPVRFSRPHARVMALLVGSLVVAGSAQGADDADPSTCRPDGNQQQMNACAVRDFRVADAGLNIRYREIMEALPASARVALRQEQRNWIKVRDSHCKTEAKSSEGGSIWPLEFYGCLEASTHARTAELEDWKARR